MANGGMVNPLIAAHALCLNSPKVIKSRLVIGPYDFRKGYCTREVLLPS
jgi:hypothetical protein